MKNKNNKQEDEPCPVDLSLVCNNLEGDMDLIRGFVENFLEIYPDQMDELKKAIDLNDPGSVRLKAHSLKSTFNTFGVFKAAKLSLELEVMGKENNLENAKEIMTNLFYATKEVDIFFSSDWEKNITGNRP